MTCNVGKFTYFFGVFVTFSSYTFAPWASMLENIPSNDIKKTCEGWILFHDFKALNNDGNENRDKALSRRREFDRYMSVWAAGYAYYISGFTRDDMRGFTPYDFCRKNGMDDELLSFAALYEAKNTCVGWIIFYGYYEDYNNPNWYLALSRNVSDDGIISIWTAGFARFIADVPDSVYRTTMTPENYCLGIGKSTTPQPQVMEFMSLNDTVMPCEKWIELFEYTNNPLINTQKALNSIMIFKDYISIWTKLYIEAIVEILTRVLDTDDLMLTIPELSSVKKPSDFCSLISKPNTIDVHYSHD